MQPDAVAVGTDGSNGPYKRWVNVSDIVDIEAGENVARDRASAYANDKGPPATFVMPLIFSVDDLSGNRSKVLPASAVLCRKRIHIRTHSLM